MDHKLRITVRLEMDSPTTVLVLTGCLTAESCLALFPIIGRAASLIGRQSVTVDLSRARHIEAAALTMLQNSQFQLLTVNVPAVLPDCPALPSPSGAWLREVAA
jgi:ABC-type transporter Mla MlaB component